MGAVIMIKNKPKEIFLQIGEDTPVNADFQELNKLPGGLTWSTERIYDNDIRYVLAPEEKAEERIMFKQIVDAILLHFNVTFEDIHNNKTRARCYVLPRQACHYLLNKKTKISLSKIGMRVGRKDHATVLHSCRTIRNLLQTDKEFRKQIEEIEKEIESNINY